MGVKFAKHLKRRSGSTNDDSSSSWTKYQQRIAPPKSTLTIGSGSEICTIDNSYFVGWDTPNYNKRRNRGELIPMTPWRSFTCEGTSSGEQDVQYTSGGTTNRYYTVGNYSVESGWILTEEDLASSIPDTYDQYVQEAAAAIYSNGFDALTFLAELTDVRRMFTSLLRGIAKVHIPSNIREVSGAWLSSRYGWRTLIFDIQDINKAIINLKSGFDRYSEGRGGQYSTTTTDSWTEDLPNYDRQYVIDDRITVGLRGHVVADVNVPRIQLNPLVTGWEKIPFSFVLDWVFSVGKALSALAFVNADATYVAASGYQVEMTRTYNSSVVPGSESSITDHAIHWQTATCTATLKVRTPCRVPLIPRYSLRLNKFKAIDLLGLTAQRLPRR